MGHAGRRSRVDLVAGVLAAAVGAMWFLASCGGHCMSLPQAALTAAASSHCRTCSDSGLLRRGRARRFGCLSTTSLAAQFEEGLSLQEMLRLQKQRQAATSGPRASAPPDADLVAAVATQEELIAELPCVFAPRQQPEKSIGDDIVVNFFDKRYVKLWDYARSRTGGAVAIRYAAGNLRRADHAFALWPAQPEGSRVIGLNLGLFGVSVVTIHPFPLVRLFQDKNVGQAALGEGTSGIQVSNPAELHSYLWSLGNVEKQRQALAEMPTSLRLELLRWLANGADE